MSTDPASRTPEQQELVALPQRLAEEMTEADAYLIATPLYNWNIPAALKVWIDHLMLNWSLPDQLAGRPAVIVTAKGGAYGPGTPKHGWDLRRAISAARVGRGARAAGRCRLSRAAAC